MQHRPGEEGGAGVQGGGGHGADEGPAREGGVHPGEVVREERGSRHTRHTRHIKHTRYTRHTRHTRHTKQ